MFIVFCSLSCQSSYLYTRMINQFRLEVNFGAFQDGNAIFTNNHTQHQTQWRFEHVSGFQDSLPDSITVGLAGFTYGTFNCLKQICSSHPLKRLLLNYCLDSRNVSTQIEHTNVLCPVGLNISIANQRIQIIERCARQFRVPQPI